MKINKTLDGSLTASHPEHGEWFHSKDGAVLETLELYIKGSNIEESFVAASTSSPPIKVLDVGLGLGFNAIYTIDTWARQNSPVDLELTSLEIDLELVETLINDAPWMENWPDQHKHWIKCLSSKNAIVHPSGSKKCLWNVIIGDALNSKLPKIDRNNHGWNFIWQDPFSPAKNPSLWSTEWFRKLKATSNPNCKLLTYSVARSVRDALSEAGWQWEKFSSPVSTKRHWLRASILSS